MSMTLNIFQPRRSARVLTCVASPLDPGEVHELAAIDVTVDHEGARYNGVHYKVFAQADRAFGRGGIECDARQVAACVYGGRLPDVLVSHDASTASCVFAPHLTNGIPWVSTSKLARRIWPGQHSYELDSLALWRAWPRPREACTSTLPSGAARDAELTARLFVDLLDDPGLIGVAEAVFLDEIERGGSGTHPSFGGWNALEAAVAISALPSKPLRDPVWPFDDQDEWACIGTEDLRYFVRFSDDQMIADAAEAALRSRLGEA